MNFRVTRTNKSFDRLMNEIWAWLDLKMFRKFAFFFFFFFSVVATSVAEVEFFHRYFPTYFRYFCIFVFSLSMLNLNFNTVFLRREKSQRRIRLKNKIKVWQGRYVYTVEIIHHFTFSTEIMTNVCRLSKLCCTIFKIQWGTGNPEEDREETDSRFQESISTCGYALRIYI